MGRASTLDLVDRAVAGTSPHRIVYVHGPGGVGKSAVLRAMERRATEAGGTVVHLDGRMLPPAPDAIEATLEAAGAGADGVVVIDTGSSRLYGEQMRRAIAGVTDKPIRMVLVTHHHPDHYFGNQVFGDVTVMALPGSIGGMKQEGGAFADNLYRMAGDWMSGTEPVAARDEAKPGRMSIGGHDIELIALKGHTQADLVVFDRTSGVLFAGDLVFWQRAATTPHASVADWLAALEQIKALKWTTLVPGHGEPHGDARGIEQTRRYLTWLDATLRKAASDGLDMPELLRTRLPDDIAAIPLARQEFERSIAHLYRGFEQDEFDKRPTK